MIFIIIVLIFSTVQCKPHKDVYLIPQRVSVQINSSYTLTLNHDYVTPVKCFIERKLNGTVKEKFSVNLNEEGIAPKLISKNYGQYKSDSDVITSLGNGICGFKMDLVSKETTKLWNISFVDKNEKEYFEIGRVVAMSTHPRHVIEYKKVGDALSISCAKDLIIGDPVGDIFFCEVINPQNESIKWKRKDTCIYVIDVPSKLSDFGTWKCLQHFDFNFEPTEVIYEFIPIETDIIMVDTSLTQTKLQISCSILNATTFSRINYCIFTRPDNKEIVFKAGVANERYTTLGTDFEKHKCSLEIQLPLLDEEKGLWKCALINEPTGPLGGFVNISREESKYSFKPKIPENVQLIVNSSLEISCQIFRSAPYCWFRDPKGVLYPQHTSRYNSIGLCNLKKSQVQFTENGTWFCGFGNQIGEADEVYNFNVLVHEPEPIIPQEEEVVTSTSGTVKLGCTTTSVGDFPISYCRFLSPTGQMYHIDTSGTNSDRLSYAGKGLQYGDCIITIRDVTAEDEGTWSCITMISGGRKGDEVYTNIHLKISDNLSIATTLGIAFGVGFLVIVTSVVLVRHFVKRRKYGDVTANQPINTGHEDNTLNLQYNNENISNYVDFELVRYRRNE